MEPLRLSLSDCVRLGVNGNLSVLRKQLERDEKKFDIEVSRKIFVPEASLAVKDFVDRYKNVTIDQAITKTFSDGSKGGVRTSTSDDWNLPTRNSRTHGVFLTRPLLRNFGRHIAGYGVELNIIDYDLAIETFISDLNDFIYKTGTTYFDLAFARKNLEITQQACLRAKRQFDDTKNDIELGTIAEQEIYLVEENLVEFEIRRENAKHEIARLELELKKAMNIDPAVETPLAVSLPVLSSSISTRMASAASIASIASIASDAPVFPVSLNTPLTLNASLTSDAPLASAPSLARAPDSDSAGVSPPETGIPEAFFEAATFSSAVDAMLANNPDFRMKELSLKRSQTDLAWQKNQYLPQLDLNAEYKWREGRDFSQRDFFALGVQYDIPLTRNSDRALVNKFRMNEQIQRLSKQDAQLVLTYELKRIFLDIEHLEHILKARSRVVELSRKKLDAETEKYKNGFTTLADIVRFQRELEDSLLEELSTSVSLNKLRMNRLLIEGTLYKAFEIAIGS
ncbi:MAG: TolC family protein [Candidatus Ozemobacteraceae bacterium]